MKNIVLTSIAISCLVTACYAPGPDGEPVLVVNLAPSPCVPAEQYARETGANVTIEGLQGIDISASANTNPNLLVEYSDQIAALQNQASQVCQFFNRGRIDFTQYQSEMREIRQQLEEIAQNIDITH